MSDSGALIDDIAALSHDPLGFVEYAFPWGEEGELAESYGPREWQADVLDSIGEHLRGGQRFTPLQVAVSSGHGIGKSALIGQIIAWAMSTCEDCKIVLTANTEAQLRTKTWPEVSKWFRLAINADWWNLKGESITIRDKAHERVWRTDAIAWSENNTEAFAGLHNKGKRLVLIFDEGSAIADRVWEVAEGALTDEDTEIIWLVFGNPTRNTGRFRECFGRYKHRWLTRQIDSRTVDGTNNEQLAKWIADYGEDSDFCRVRIRGEFPRAGSTQFIAGDVVAAARKRQCAGRGWSILAVDVARFGDDQTILGMRQGERFDILAKLRGLDTFQVAQRVMEVMRRDVPRLTVIDGDGIGAGVVDIVRANMVQWFRDNSPARLYEFHGGGKPADPEMYYNQRAEVWGRAKSWLLTGCIPDDPELEADLTGPEYFFSTKNQIQLEKKEDMKRRGQASPDLGDALAYSFAIVPPALTQREILNERLAEVMETSTDPTTAMIRQGKILQDQKKKTERYRRQYR